MTVKDVHVKLVEMFPGYEITATCLVAEDGRELWSGAITQPIQCTCGGRVRLIASAHVCNSFEAMVAELCNRAAERGVVPCTGQAPSEGGIGESGGKAR